ncbi:MAG TPA: hypothetical protein VIH47_09470 [Solirubrobacterales bacterium]
MGVLHDDDDLWLLRSLAVESVDLIYLDPAFFCNWIDAHMDWIAAPLEDLHRILKPAGALFLICDETVGPYLRALLEDFRDQRSADDRMIWWQADSPPAHHHVFYYRKAGEFASQHGHLYTVIRREGEEDSSLMAFSFLHGRLKSSLLNCRVALRSAD